MMQRVTWWLRVLVVVFMVAGLSVRGSFAQNESSEYFSETGHWVYGDILQAYRSVSNPALLYGYPITEAFVSQKAGEVGLQIQYFDKARFEFHPENPADLRVEISPLGRYLYELDKPGSSVPITHGAPGCRYFSEVDFQVCYAFLDFFEDYGGISQFGYPASDLEFHDGWVVQYFQRARFEWHPEHPSGQRVVLTDVGSQYFQAYEDPYLALPRTDARLHVVQELQVSAYLTEPVLPASGVQTIYVVVQDQSLSAVASAVVNIKVRLPGGGELFFITPPTDEKGVTRLEFLVTDQPLGIVEIQVEATYNVGSTLLQEQTITSYRVWY
jgi:hypothetical protein